LKIIPNNFQENYMSKMNPVKSKSISRRDFINTSALVASAALVKPFLRPGLIEDFPVSDRLGRIAASMVDIKIRPDYDAPNIGAYYEDKVIPWLREVIGPWPFRNNQRWVETPDGYIWAPNVQPVKNLINTPVSVIPDGIEGIWVEVTVPWVNAILDNPPARSSWWAWQASNNLPPRFYYSQVLWVDQIKAGSDGNLWYRINERYGNPGDLFWAPAQAFRPISSAEMTPITPDVENKQIVIDATPSHQTLSCFEGNTEVYYCRISSGKIPFKTPLSASGYPGFHIWRKLHSIQMAGGTNQAGWMIPGIGWATFFLGSGVAIHSTFWHNNFGEPSSHGCVNAAPEDAKWIFRWASPVTPFQEGDITVSGTIGTPVKVIEY
jgi:lipoprotein-anchoring transpeptidase ErfK/SrfK